MIRHATHDDLPAIDAIYNQAVACGLLTADTEPVSSAERGEWFGRFVPDAYPLFVYEMDGQVVGWASLSPHRPGRKALEEVAEISFYVDFAHHGKGIGSRLVAHCEAQSAVLRKRVFFSITIESNRASLRLLERHGYERWGYLPDVIRVGNARRGQVYMGKILHRELPDW